MDIRLWNKYYENFAKPNRWDNGETIFFKRLFQHILPLEARSQIISELFSQNVTSDEAAFAETLYLSESNLKELINAGNLAGAHTVNHLWLDTLSKVAQRYELSSSKEFLIELGVKESQISVAYPFGGYNAETLEVCEDLGYNLGFTTVPKKVESISTLAQKLTIPRLDTNDLPPRNQIFKMNQF